MMPLPWTAGVVTAPPERVTVMASRLELRRLRDVPAFLAAALRLRRRFRSAPGGVGLALGAEPLRRTFWTLSAWTDERALGGYAADPLHAEVMRRFRPAMAGSTFVTWTAPGAPPPAWEEARSRLSRQDASGGDGGRTRPPGGGPTLVAPPGDR